MSQGALSSVLSRYQACYAGLPRACWQGMVLTLLNAVSIGVCFFLVLYFVGTLRVSIPIAGMMMSMYGAGTVLGGMASGAITDRFSPQRVAGVSLFLQSAAFFVLASLSSIPLLIADMFVLGVATYSFKTANQAWVLSECETHSATRLNTISLMHVASNLGLGISGVMMGLCVTADFTGIFYLSSAILFLSAVSVVTRHPASSTNKSQAPENERNHTLTVSSMPTLILILICVFAIGLIISQLGATYPLYVQQTFPSLGTRAVSILFLLDTVLIVLFQAPLVNALNRYDPMIVAGIGGLCMGLGMLVLSMAASFMIAIVSCVIWTTGEMLFISNAQLVCYESGADKKKGQSLGAFQAAFALSAVLGPAAGSMLYHLAGGVVLWRISFTIGVLCLMACLSFSFRRRSN